MPSNFTVIIEPNYSLNIILWDATLLLHQAIQIPSKFERYLRLFTNRTRHTGSGHPNFARIRLGLTSFEKDRVNQDGGSGVLVTVRSCYPAVDVEIEADCELAWVTVSLKIKRKIHLGSFYRPPSAGPEPLDQLDSALRNLHSTTKNPNSTVILGGDFNCGYINWDTNTITQRGAPVDPLTRNYST